MTNIKINTHNKTKTYFITATDTNVGKTTICVELLKQAKSNNQTALGLKPMATGCDNINNKLYNQDALLLQKYSNCYIDNIKLNTISDIPYTDINPFSFEPPVSPHIVNKDIYIKQISDKIINAINKYQPDLCYIEGAGGLLCPINDQEDFSDLILELSKNINIEIILVIPIQLGCLNHALLTVEAVLSRKLKIHGWIANCLDLNNKYISENIEYLKNKIYAPLLSVYNY